MNKNSIASNFRVLGVCGGNGVILYPLKRNVIMNIEPRGLFHTKGEEQWNINFKDIPLEKTLVDIKDTKNLVIVGAPDCGHSSALSVSRTKKFGNPRDNKSMNFYWESIHKYKPNIWLMENLSKLLNQIPLQEIKDNFPEYRILKFEGSLSVFGNSQINRKRLILIGIKREYKELIKYFNVEIHKLNDIENSRKYKWTTCKDLYGRIPLNISGNIREDPEDFICMYSKYKITWKEAQEFWLNQDKDKKRWEVKGRNFTTAPGVYRNIDDSFPAVCRKVNRQFTQDGLPLTPRQLANIQGLPLSFKIYFPKKLTKKTKTFWLNKSRITITKTPPFEVTNWLNNLLLTSPV